MPMARMNIRSVSQFDSDLTNVDPTGSTDSNPDLITAGADETSWSSPSTEGNKPGQ